MKKKNDSSHTTGITVTGEDNVFIDCDVNGFDKGIELGKTAKRNRFINADITTNNKKSKKWYEKPFGIVILGIIASLIAAVIINYFISN